jgi:diacylglycerol kinase family enzyme/membrane-associated phospholipid phosphatase
MPARLVDRVRRLDETLFARAAGADTPMLDAVLPRLTRAANHGALWFGVAAGLAATGRTGRRAAARGLTSLAVASATVNGPAKWVFRRTRPQLTAVPVLRQVRRQPRTTSFPSGHSASAAAFATGVALQSPVIGLPVAVVAAAVVYSRVHTGVHYPSDVIVGAATGVGAALLVRRSWPVPPDRPAVAGSAQADAPALPDGTGLVVVVNAAAGSADADEVRDALGERLPGSEVVVSSEGEDLAEVFGKVAERATVLGVAGGDGTVNCAAQAALKHDLPLAVVPAGTLNHFAAELGIDDADDIAAAVQRGEAVEISVGSAAPDGDDLYFLNTFSLGTYPELVRRRERRERWLGKWGALAVALAEVLGRAEPLHIEVDDQPRRVWLLFGGNGRYHPPGFAPTWRDRLDDARIDVRIVDAEQPFGRLRLVAAVLSGRLGRCRVYEERVVDRLSVRLPGDGHRLARDGEAQPAPRELVLRPAARRLVVYRPASE